MTPTVVSVIIPCFNQGKFIDEAVNSILQQTYKNYEVIIVNDGSTDFGTNQLLRTIYYPNTRVIWSQNRGLPSARNIGITASKGCYILPLDADDKIGPTYLEDAVKILDENSDIGIVYCDAEFFGEQTGPFDLPSFTKERLLIENIIFCTAFFRKKDWEKVGGFNPKMVCGWEDWDFWLSILELDRNVYKIPKRLFFCRKRTDSMIGRMNSYQKTFLRLQVIDNHRNLYKKIKTKCLPFLGYSQVFINTGNGFNQSESIIQPLHSYHSKINFDLTNYKKIQSLRFDPINDYAEALIAESQIVYKDGSTEYIMFQQDNALTRNGNYYLFDHEDPQLIFTTPRIGELARLSIDLEFKTVGKESCEAIGKFYHKQAENGRSWLTSIKRYILSL